MTRQFLEFDISLTNYLKVDIIFNKLYTIDINRQI